MLVPGFMRQQSVSSNSHDTRSKEETQLLGGWKQGRSNGAQQGVKRVAARRRLRWLVLLIVCGGLMMIQPLRAASFRQGNAVSTAIVAPVIHPAAPTDATLHTHIASIVLDVDAQGGLFVRVEATYDIRNDTETDLLAPLSIANVAQFDLALLQDGAPVPVTLEDDGRATVAIAVPADGRTELTLRASHAAAQSPLMRLVYPTELLRQWRGQRSVRVALTPGAVTADSWLRVEPDTWRYAAAEATQIEWLFESELPVQILLQAITPATWQALQTAAAGASGSALDQWAALGQRYRALADAAAQLGDAAAQTRFMAQATAAYTEGIRQGEATGVAVSDLADLHAGLAALYHAHVTAAGRTEDAQAMVVEAGLALQGLVVDDPRRAELEQWQVDGLRLMLADLRRRGDIPGALALIEQFQTLPAGASGSAFLAQERRRWSCSRRYNSSNRVIAPRR